jgi:dolichol-phosphate mannosyltransferase
MKSRTGYARRGGDRVVSLISIIIPVLNEEENLPALHDRLENVTKDSENDFEFIFIDDGSTDNTFNTMKALSEKDSRVKVIRFSRNFGSHSACLAGLRYSKGNACVFISADLQDPPELIGRLIDEWKNGYEVVIGVREWAEGSQRLLPRTYYRLVRRLALRNMPESGTDVFLIDRKVINAVTSMDEKNTSIFGLILWSGFKQKVITYKKMQRRYGVSKWTTGKKIKLFIDTFVAFSYFPIRMVSVTGFIFAMFGFLYAIIVILNKIILQRPVEGWTSLMIVLLMTSGVQLIMLGVIGEYVWRAVDASRKRPSFIVSETININNKQVN